MPNEDRLLSRKLNVDNIDPDLFRRFKVCLMHKGLTMREVIIDYLEAFAEAVEAEIKKAKRR
jgi:hypothetical protein